MVYLPSPSAPGFSVYDSDASPAWASRPMRLMVPKQRAQAEKIPMVNMEMFKTSGTQRYKSKIQAKPLSPSVQDLSAVKGGLDQALKNTEGHKGNKRDCFGAGGAARPNLNRRKQRKQRKKREPVFAFPLFPPVKPSESVLRTG